jgi:hypothetical protein
MIVFRDPIVSKPYKATWLGRAGTLIEYKFDRKRNGKRVVVIAWTDDGSYSLTAIRGDGRMIDHEVYEKLNLPHLSEAAVMANVRALADRHFPA